MRGRGRKLDKDGRFGVKRHKARDSANCPPHPLPVGAHRLWFRLRSDHLRSVSLPNREQQDNASPDTWTHSVWGGVGWGVCGWGVGCILELAGHSNTEACGRLKSVWGAWMRRLHSWTEVWSIAFSHRYKVRICLSVVYNMHKFSTRILSTLSGSLAQS